MDAHPDDYAEDVTVVVRHAADQMASDAWDEAIVLDIHSGDLLDLRGLNADVNRWLNDVDASGWNHVEVRRRGINIGAAGVEVAIIVSLLGGALGGVSGKLLEFVWDNVATRLGRARDQVPPIDDSFEAVEGMRRAVARAMDARVFDLKLVEGRIAADRHAAIFEDGSGESTVSSAGPTEHFSCGD